MPIQPPRSLVYRPELEGIRALAFLLVFSAHYTAHDWRLTGQSPTYDLWLMSCQLFFCAVPMFFVLSGYLITGVLLKARGSESFFRRFYTRRALRILPLYYLVLLTTLIVAELMHTTLRWRLALFPLYLQNFWLTDDIYLVNPWLHLGHLWSLAVEEQFYLLWPLVIVLCRTDRSLLRCCYSILATSFLARLTWGLLGKDHAIFAYTNTLFRCDALILGAILFIVLRRDPSMLDRLIWPARGSIIAGVAILGARAYKTGSSLPFDTFGICVTLPVLSILGLALITLTLKPGCLINRAATWQWAVTLGKRSYSLYVIHQLFLQVTLDRLRPLLQAWCGPVLGHIVAAAGAFLVTLGLSECAYRLVEVRFSDWARRVDVVRNESLPQPATGVFEQPRVVNP